MYGFVLGSPEFKSSTTFAKNQLVYLRPVGILNPIRKADLHANKANRSSTTALTQLADTL